MMQECYIKVAGVYKGLKELQKSLGRITELLSSTARESSTGILAMATISKYPG